MPESEYNIIRTKRVSWIPGVVREEALCHKPLQAKVLRSGAGAYM